MKKNILFVTADQMRGDCLSAMGHKHVKTPNFDALIKDGIAFAQHYSVCVPCSPARASLLTGMYLQNHRVTRNGTPLDHRHTNIAKELRKAGYKPTLFGYTDTSLDPRFHSEENVMKYGDESIMPGFDEGVLMSQANPQEWLDWLTQKGYHFKKAKDAFQIDEESHQPNTARAGKPLLIKSEHSQTAFLTDRAIKHIDHHSPDHNTGWCIHLSFARPHPPFIAPKPYHNMYNPDDMDSKKRQHHEKEHPYLTVAKSPLGDWSEPWIQELTAHADDKTYDQEIRQVKATYYGLISKVDHYFGILIDHLKKIGEYDNTLIIMTADHAELMGDHGLFGKQGFYKESYHIPLVIRDPNQLKEHRGHIEKSFSESVDIMPTILDWADQPIPRQCNGKSLLPFIEGSLSTSSKSFWRQDVYWECDFHDIQSPLWEKALKLKSKDCKLNVVLNNRYMFVYFPTLPSLLFDLKVDPNAEHNVIDEPRNSALIIELLQRLLTWRMRHDDPALTDYVISRKEIYQL